MKKLLIGLFLVSSVLAFSERVVKGDKAYADNKGIVYVEGEKTPYTGVIEGYNEQGTLEGKASYKDGKMNGSSKLYYPSGKLLQKRNFINGKAEGEVIEYYESGAIKEKAYFINDKQEKEHFFYDEKGNLIKTDIYKNDVKQ